MRVAYNPKNGRVFRLLTDDFQEYEPGFDYSIIEVVSENQPDLIVALLSRPQKFTYDGVKFVEDIGGGQTVDWQIESEPPRSTHISVLEAIDALKARPARIRRVWEGESYYFDCFVTETVKDQYIAGDIQVGDYMLVHFDDIGEQIVIAKVYKSWV